MISVKTASIFVFLAFSISLASADESRFHQYDYNDVSTLQIDARVGTILVGPSTSGKFEVELLISDENKRRWFSRSPDMSRMDLRSTKRGSQLRLSFDHKDVKTEWVVRVPDVEQISIELGVGTIEVNRLAAGITAEVGVGTVEIRTPADSAGMVDLSVGVGETVVRGGSNTHSRRALVSSESSAQGYGSKTIKARAGVGSVEVELL